MPRVSPENPTFKLSICITTRNRAAYIGPTLDSIIEQVTDDCEIVIVDGASTDGTEKVVSQYADRFAHLIYLRQEINNGIDRGFNQAVEHARGEYFWLMPDDDYLKPGAIATVLNALRRDYSLIVVNVEYRTLDMSAVLQESDLTITSDCEFAPMESDQLFETCWKLIRYSGAIVMKRAIWLARERELYYDSYWMDVAVVFQERLPGTTLVIATPLISVRMDNQSWLSHIFKVFYVTWPSLVRSLPLSDSVKKEACADDPSHRISFLLLVRAAGQYSLVEYREYIRPRLHSITERASAKLVAILPRVILNVCLVLYYSTIERKYGRFALLLLTQSPFYIRSRHSVQKA